MQMSNEEFKRELLDNILQIHPINKVSHKQYAIRCPLCGDSRKNARSTHFYIMIDVNEDVPVLYNCFKCNAGGFINSTVLRSLDIHDLAINGALIKYNKQMTKKFKDYRINGGSLNLKIPSINNVNEGNLIKKKYLEERLGREFSFEEIEALKIVFSLGDLLLQNDIKNITCKKDKAIDLDKNYLGFLSVNDEKLIMRQVLPSKYLRYENYTIDKNVMDTKKFYVIPTKVDIMNPETIEINIAEGALDILGVYYNVHNGGHKNAIYAGATGSSFRTVIDYFLRLGIVGNVRLNLYSDSEIPVDAYSYVYNTYGIWIDEINIFYNELSKDTGVPADQIRLIKKKPKWVR